MVGVSPIQRGGSRLHVYTHTDVHSTGRIRSPSLVAVHTQTHTPFLLCQRLHACKLLVCVCSAVTLSSHVLYMLFIQLRFIIFSFFVQYLRHSSAASTSPSVAVFVFEAQTNACVHIFGWRYYVSYEPLCIFKCARLNTLRHTLLCLCSWVKSAPLVHSICVSSCVGISLLFLLLLLLRLLLLLMLQDSPQVNETPSHHAKWNILSRALSLHSSMAQLQGSLHS